MTLHKQAQEALDAIQKTVTKISDSSCDIWISCVILETIRRCLKLAADESYVRVPRKPTAKMIRAAWREQYLFMGATQEEADILSMDRVNDSEKFIKDVLVGEAMIAAAESDEK